MKLRNKKTGEIIILIDHIFDNYKNLDEFKAEWEDYEEPKEYWYISDGGDVYGFSDYYVGSEIEEAHREIDNLFETKEEAKQAVEKLKAWKRLKDKGFRFHEWYKPDGCEPFIVVETNIDLDDVDNMKLQKDLDLLFGGEE